MLVRSTNGGRVPSVLLPVVGFIGILAAVQRAGRGTARFFCTYRMHSFRMRRWSALPKLIGLGIVLISPAFTSSISHSGLRPVGLQGVTEETSSTRS